MWFHSICESKIVYKSRMYVILLGSIFCNILIFCVKYQYVLEESWVKFKMHIVTLRKH